MPSAISSPSEPVETVSTSIARLFLPSRMIEPLPKLRSICESAASRAFDLSMDDPSTRRSAALMFRAPYGGDSTGSQRTPNRPSSRAQNLILKLLPPCPSLADRFEHRTLFVLSSQYVLFAAVGTGLFPKLLAGFENRSGRI